MRLRLWHFRHRSLSSSSLPSAALAAAAAADCGVWAESSAPTPALTDELLEEERWVCVRARPQLCASTAPEALTARVLLSADLLRAIFWHLGLCGALAAAATCRVWRQTAEEFRDMIKVLELVSTIHASPEQHYFPSHAQSESQEEAQPQLGPFSWTCNFLMGQCLDDSQEHMFIVDSSNQVVKKVRLSDGAVSRSVHFLLSSDAFAGCGSLRYPQGLAIYEAQVFVADLLNARIVVFDTDFHFIRTFRLQPTSSGMSASPYGLAVHDHVLYIADCSGSRVLKYRPSGEYLGILGSDAQFRHPRGLALGTLAGGHSSPLTSQRSSTDSDAGCSVLFVSEQCRVQVVSLSGDLLQVLSIPAARSLWGLSIHAGRVLVADQNRRSLHVLRARYTTDAAHYLRTR